MNMKHVNTSLSLIFGIIMVVQHICMSYNCFCISPNPTLHVCTQCRIICTSPYTHQVRELLPFASALGFAVEEYAASKGKIPPRKRRKKKVIYIATIEKVWCLSKHIISSALLSAI